ncbi:MAG: type VI secretion system lipoprotein TssJ [Pseudomonadota bacterium]
MGRNEFAYRRRLIGALPLAAVAFGLASCGGGVELPPPTPPTGVNLTVTGTAALNGGAPAKVKVYYLSSDAAFNSGDFFGLFDSPQATLGADLKSVDEYLLAPGESVTATKVFPPGSEPALMGVVAGFRSVDQPGWRALAPITANQMNTVTATAGDGTVSMSASAVAAPEVN